MAVVGEAAASAAVREAEDSAGSVEAAAEAAGPPAVGSVEE